MFLLPIDSSAEEREEEQEAASMREMAAVVLVLRTGKDSDVELFEQAYYSISPNQPLEISGPLPIPKEHTLPSSTP